MTGHSWQGACPYKVQLATCVLIEHVSRLKQDDLFLGLGKAAMFSRVVFTKRSNVVETLSFSAAPCLC